MDRMGSSTSAALFSQALDHQRAGRNDQAASLCEDILAAEPGHPRALHLLGAMRFVSGRREEAVGLLRRAVEAAPDYVEAYFNLAAMLASGGDLAGASEHYGRAALLRPEHPDAPSRYATTLLALGRRPEAEAFLRAALAGRPDNVGVLNSLSSLALQGGDKREAEAFARQAVSLAPATALCHVRLGSALRERQAYEEAKSSFREALRLEPDHDVALYYLGSVFHAELDFETAADYFRRALAIDPGNSAARDGLDLIRQGLAFGTGSGLQGAHRPSRQVFMSAVVSLLQSRPPPVRVLEVGSYMGASAITWGRALHRLYGKPSHLLCVDRWANSPDQYYDEVMQSSLGSGLAYRTFLSNIATLPGSVTVDHRRGPSSSTLRDLDTESFDIIYIDGSHFYGDVIEDLAQARRLVREGGFICGDDLELQASGCDMEVARRNRDGDAMSDPLTGETYHPGVTLAVSEAFGPVSAFDGFWVVQKKDGRYGAVSFRGATAILPVHWPRRTVEALRARFSDRREIAGLAGGDW